MEDYLLYAFPYLDFRKTSATNLLEHLNREIHRHTSAVGILPNSDAYICLVTGYLMEYTEDWSVSNDYLCAQSFQDLLRSTV